MSTYPTLRLGVLNGLVALKAAIDADDKFLMRPECPYDNDTIEILDNLFKAKEIYVEKEIYIEKPQQKKRGRPKKDKELSEDDSAEVEKEAKELLKELRQLATNSDGELKDLDTATKLQIIKTRTSLVEKLVSLRERTTGMRKVIEFQQTVIGILDELVPEDNRNVFLERLEEFL